MFDKIYLKKNFFGGKEHCKGFFARIRENYMRSVERVEQVPILSAFWKLSF